MAQALNRWSRHRRPEVSQLGTEKTDAKISQTLEDSEAPKDKTDKTHEFRSSGWRGGGQRSQESSHKNEGRPEPASRGTEEAHNSTALLRLRSGIQMPRFGLGTWQSQRGGECRRAVLEALRVGYRLIDTAQVYGNEADVGQALQEAQVSRDEVFVVTKLSSREHGGGNPAAALKASLARLRLEYVDLFLIHSPRGGLLLETWDSLVQLRNAGLTRAIGVSNFGCEQILSLQRSGRELPEVNQIELHCFWQQKETESLCNDLNIALMAYSPLARGSLFGSTTLAQLAQQRACSEAALCIRWAFQKGFVVIPKSVNPQRIQTNITALSGPGLTPREMQAIELLDQGFCSCPAAKAMQTAWEEVATKMPDRKGKGKGKSKSKAKASSGQPSWVEAFS